MSESDLKIKENRKSKNIEKAVMIFLLSSILLTIWTSDPLFIRNSKEIYWRSEFSVSPPYGTLRINRVSGRIDEAVECGLYSIEPIWVEIGYAKNDVEKEKIIELFKIQYEDNQKQIALKKLPKYLSVEDIMEASSRES